MSADLPPTAAVEHVVNDAVTDLGVGRPAVLDVVDALGAPHRAHVDAAACLHLDVGHETALALGAHAHTGGTHR